jgi:soluble lytic murein transglycosylase-like protein
VLHPELSDYVVLDGVRDAVMSWHIPNAAPALRGARLLADAAAPAPLDVALAKSIVRSNHRLTPLDALRLAIVAQISARHASLDANFFGATILQESAFDPFAVSSAGALGIAQFMLSTADDVNVDPMNVRQALGGSAQLLAEYVTQYRGRFGKSDPYALALAAYNAGPLAVDYYHGVPPYAETRGYINDIDDRLARIISDEQGQEAAVAVAAPALRRR